MQDLLQTGLQSHLGPRWLPTEARFIPNWATKSFRATVAANRSKIYSKLGYKVIWGLGGCQQNHDLLQTGLQSHLEPTESRFTPNWDTKSFGASVAANRSKIYSKLGYKMIWGHGGCQQKQDLLQTGIQSNLGPRWLPTEARFTQSWATK